MKAKDIIDIMYKWAGKDLIDTWDNTGFQIGNCHKTIKKILLALDLDRWILNKALMEEFDMIITHHPIIFKPIKNITNESEKGSLILDIIKNDLVVFNAHSNLDIAEDGVNHELSRLLGLKDQEILRVLEDKTSYDFEGVPTLYGYGRVGNIEERPLMDFIGFVKEKLEIEDLIVYGDIDQIIRRVAVCGGSGSDFITDAVKANADLYITGDIKYHDAQLAYESGLTIFDAGHYNTEKVILPIIKNYLRKELGEELLIKVVMESGLPHKIY